MGRIIKVKKNKPTKTNDIEKEDNDYANDTENKDTTPRGTRRMGNKIEVDPKINSPPKSPIKKMPGRVGNTFNCEHCNADIPYNMQQVDYHLRDHGYTMAGYMTKYDVSDNPNLDTMRRWINKLKPRKPAARPAPIKIKSEKLDYSAEASTTEVPEVKTEKDEQCSNNQVVGSSSLYVEEYQRRKERDQSQNSLTERLQDQNITVVKSEELLDTMDGTNFKVYPKIPYDVLVALSVRNLDRENFRGANFNQIIAFICLHFPYFNSNVDECKALIKKSYNKVQNEEDKLKIQEEQMPQLRQRIDNWRARNKNEVKQFMWIPDFLETLLERFSDQNYLFTGNPALKARPPYSRKMVLYLVLISISPPSSMEKIWIIITFLFPSLEKTVQGFERNDFETDLLEEENIDEDMDDSGQKVYAIREGLQHEVRHNVRSYFSTFSNLKQLKKSILKPEFVDLLLPNLSM